MKEVGAQVDMAKEVRYGQGWFEFPDGGGVNPPEEAPPLQAAIGIDGPPSVPGTGAYGTDLPYYPQMVTVDKATAEVDEALLPFEITVTADTLKAAPGTIDVDAIGETTESSPANGTWYLESKVTINSTTGAITATAAQWATSASSNTSTEFYSTIGTVAVVDGAPDPTSINQFNYGPLLVIPHGTPTDKWAVLIY